MSAAATVLVVALGAGISAVCARWWERSMRTPRFLRTNYRGREVVSSGGVVLAGPLAVGTVAVMLTGRSSDVAVTMLWCASAMGLLGFVDDVYGDRRAGGLLGHARELLRGHMTTGMLKAGGGAVLGLVAAWSLGLRGGWIVVGGAVVALSANMANLLDLRPGRTIKVWLLGVVVLALSGVWGGGQTVLAALIGGATVFGAVELRERIMLGDAGANLLGAVAGVGAIAALEATALLAALGTLVALTLASEMISFSRVIEGVPPLRWIDGLGRHG